jgi:hypothetical protein
VQDDTGAVARGQIRPGITATGAKIIARGVDGQGGKIDIQSDEGTRTNAYADVRSHSWGGSNYGARWEVVEFEPTVLLGKNIRIGGGEVERTVIISESGAQLFERWPFDFLHTTVSLCSEIFN